MAIYVDPTAILIGDVKLEDGVSIWPYAVLRGDQERIVVGEGTNVQDTAVLHVGPGRPTIIGKDCSIGHGAVINGALIGDRCIIGMNSSILDGADVGEECIIGANAVVTSKMTVPPRSVVVGVPGRIVRSNDQTAGERALSNARVYQKLRDEHLDGKYTRRTVP
ncbi:MAG: gamma carbonic anhydrase family protein [Methanomassiliicoccales archaeon]|jgi:carbonic anhydrase/acetyltransferase-like protein (isoleucine patch superfamily)